MDQFSLNQHKFVDEGANQKEMQEMVVNALQSEMIRSAHVLMCLHPWNQPVPLRRMWCLFELFTAVSNGVATSGGHRAEGTREYGNEVKSRGIGISLNSRTDLDESGASGATWSLEIWF